MARWLPPNGLTGKMHQIDANVGGRQRMSLENFTTGKSIGFRGAYRELVSHERLRYTDCVDDPSLSRGCSEFRLGSRIAVRSDETKFSGASVHETTFAFPTTRYPNVATTTRRCYRADHPALATGISGVSRPWPNSGT